MQLDQSVPGLTRKAIVLPRRLNDMLEDNSLDLERKFVEVIDTLQMQVNACADELAAFAHNHFEPLAHAATVRPM